MTINDLELCDHFRKLFANFSVIENYTRNGQQHQLFLALSEIEMAAQAAQQRLNQMYLRWPNA